MRRASKLELSLLAHKLLTRLVYRSHFTCGEHSARTRSTFQILRARSDGDSSGCGTWLFGTDLALCA